MSIFQRFRRNPITDEQLREWRNDPNHGWSRRELKAADARFQRIVMTPPSLEEWQRIRERAARGEIPRRDMRDALNPVDKPTTED